MAVLNYEAMRLDGRNEAFCMQSKEVEKKSFEAFRNNKLPQLTNKFIEPLEGSSYTL